MSTPAARQASASSDQALIAQVAEGKLDALGELFERHEPALKRYLARLGVATSDIDDLVQGTFLELTRAATRFDPQYSARAFLLGIASMMVRRRRRSLQRLAVRIASFARLSSQLAIEVPAVSESVEQEARLRAIARAVEQLPSKQREAFVLVTWEGLSGEQAATALGIPIKTVWTRLHHARCALRAALQEVQP
jgi:RNA polymerase sigma factor (sigma-70 family)